MIIANADYKLINEQYPKDKIDQITKICGNLTDETAKISLLEHVNIMVGVSKNIYETIYTQLQIRERKSTNVCRLRLSYTCESDRYIISGSMRAWCEYFNWLADYGGAIDGCLFDMVNDAADNEFDRFSEIIGLQRTARAYSLKQVELTATENMTHECFTVIFTVTRNTSHEIANMRKISITQVPTNFTSNEITFIKPRFVNYDEHKFDMWKDACRYAELKYADMIAAGVSSQEAYEMLPMSVKSEIIITGTLNDWYHIFNVNLFRHPADSVHPQIREIMFPLFIEQRKLRPFAFENLKILE